MASHAPESELSLLGETLATETWNRPRSSAELAAFVMTLHERHGDFDLGI